MLYRNNGDGTFSDATRRQRSLAGSSPRWNTGPAFLDFDRDGHLDLFVSAYVAHDDATAVRARKPQQTASGKASA